MQESAAIRALLRLPRECAGQRFIIDSSRGLSVSSNPPPIVAASASGETMRTGTRSFGKKTERARDQGRAVMAYLDVAADIDIDAAVAAPVNASGEVFYELGMMYAAGRAVQLDLVLAHKWFNLAAMRGNPDAIRLRREIAGEMSAMEIAAAQRAARDWLTTH